MNDYPKIPRLQAMAVIRQWRAANGLRAHLWWPGDGKVGFVYFAIAADGTVKVGWSSDPAARVRGLGGHELVVAIEGCTLSEEGATHRFLASATTPARGREWYPSGSVVTSLAFWLRNASRTPVGEAKAWPNRPFVGHELGLGAA